MRKYFITALFSTLTFFVFAQTQIIQNLMQPTDKMYLRYKFMDALDYADFGNYDMALRTFMVLDTMYKNNGNIKYNLGVCLLQSSGSKVKAIPYLEEAAKYASVTHTGDYLDTTAAMDVYFFLGKVYMLDMKYDKAIEWLAKYRYYILKYYSPEFYTDETKEDIVFELDRNLQMCYNAKKLIANPVNIRIENLGAAINTEYDDYSPLLSSDGKTIYFTSRRYGSTGGMVDDLGKYFEDIYVSDFNEVKGVWAPSRPIGDNINTSSHDATTSISHDGKTLLLYHDENANGNVYYSDFIDNEWKPIMSFGLTINGKEWETHACLSPDKNSLYFVSDRKGGFGGRDIWVAERLANGLWSEPVNLGPKINTEFDEEAPFIMEDGVTMYFSSQGHETMGGFDIFVTTLQNGVWLDPLNVGYPINSSDDDIFLFPAKDGKTFYYSSKAKGGFGGQDIYKMTVIEPIKNFANLRGIVFDAVSYKPIEARIEVKDAETGVVVALTTTRKINGEYHITLPVGKKYTVTVENALYEPFSETIKIVKEADVNKAILMKLLPPLELKPTK